MGRSVYVPSEAEVVAYASFDGDYEFDYDDIIDYLVLELGEAFPSISADDGFIGREGRVIASNRLVRIVVAEYCGLVSVSIVPEFGYYELAVAFANRIAPRFNQIVANAFGGIYAKVAVASNGEAFFEKIAA